MLVPLDTLPNMGRCSTCRWLINGKCRRFPQWLLIVDPDRHWCGEWVYTEDVLCVQ